MTTLWIATTNQGKLNEFRNLLSGRAEIHSPAELRTYATPKETGKTFVENARIKARALKAIKNDQWVAAEDSGLEVEGLGGMPGIFSARYAGDKASDGENIAKLLKMMQIRSATKRAARFQCALIVFNPAGEEFHFDGVLEGEISPAPRGTQGFGYDPVFIPKGETKTLAELGPAVKNQISHRAQVIRKLGELL